jgi:hypothetical protein
MNRYDLIFQPAPSDDPLEALVLLFRGARDRSLEVTDEIAANGGTVKDLTLGIPGSHVDQIILDLEAVQQQRARHVGALETARADFQRLHRANRRLGWFILGLVLFQVVNLAVLLLR